jgi:hypothetical protein
LSRHGPSACRCISPERYPIYTNETDHSEIRTLPAKKRVYSTVLTILIYAIQF